MDIPTGYVRSGATVPRLLVAGAGSDLSELLMAMLTVSEIYLSVQGESTHVGRPCVFVRLTACNLRCTWCDTPYAFTGGRRMSIDEVIAEVDRMGVRLVELTGGEPLLQPESVELMERLIAGGWEVLLETGGHIPVDDVPDQVVTILDVKCPASGEAGRMHWPNLDRLSPRDEVKFVIQNRGDFEYARDVVTRHALTGRVGAILFAPVFGVLPPDTLVRWILEDRVPARLQLQAHKYIWAPETRGV
jgi:7-carboxy-7-deazaguanine synthase